jgi:hypothetical protein
LPEILAGIILELINIEEPSKVLHFDNISSINQGCSITIQKMLINSLTNTKRYQLRKSTKNGLTFSQLQNRLSLMLVPVLTAMPLSSSLGCLSIDT